MTDINDLREAYQRGKDEEHKLMMDRFLGQMTVDQLIGLATDIARERYGGHLTLMGFATHWKGCFGIMNVAGGERDEIWNMPGFSTLRDLLVNMLTEEVKKQPDEDKSTDKNSDQD